MSQRKLKPRRSRPGGASRLLGMLAASEAPAFGLSKKAGPDVVVIDSISRLAPVPLEGDLLGRYPYPYRINACRDCEGRTLDRILVDLSSVIADGANDPRILQFQERLRQDREALRRQ